MPRLLVLLFLLLAAPAGAIEAACQGHDLLAHASAAEKAALVGDVPYPDGNFWQARKGATTITLAGTYHLNDPRFDAIVPKLVPYLDAASALLVEAGPDQMQAMKDHLAAHPEMLVNTSGPTLPEALSPAEWSRLSAELKARGVPPFFAAKMQPWYVAVLIGLPACHGVKTAEMGLDRRLMAKAEAAHVPILSLEPWQTTLDAFDRLGEAGQLAMLRQALAPGTNQDDLNTTMLDAYFRGDRQLMWSWSRKLALAAPGASETANAADFARLQRLLLTDRNRAWMKPLLAAAKGRTVFVAVGAAHLGDRDGLLNLLHERGFTLTRLPF
ncbi:TraB/GumN family protein [Solirhodobacter olei]|uniref:TraB/GumN family protein n=1 Tax=Solirhodobacter olei TaxID=2493082 RepID=UPI0013E2D4EA|nr:TraB/GumN family protein [Solirhodobacter olei]